MVIGLTGQSGSGKTSVSKIFLAHGAKIIDADLISHQIIKKGCDAYEKIVMIFGEKILGNDLEINRKHLGEIVFTDSYLRGKLVEVTHKYICAEIDRLLDKYKAQSRIVVIDAPLLIEAGYHEKSDFVVVVYAPFDVLLKRIMERDKITMETAKNRINAQKTLENLSPYADFLIKNDTDLEGLTCQVESILKKILE